VKSDGPKNTSIISPDNRDSSVGRIDDAAPLFVPPPAPAPAGLFAEGQ